MLGGTKHYESYLLMKYELMAELTLSGTNIFLKTSIFRYCLFIISQ